MKYTLFIATTLLFITACAPEQQAPAPKVKKEKKATYADVPPPPKKKIELKEVEDENFSSDYMYPTTAKKTNKTTEVAKQEPLGNTPQTTVTEMTKEECIGLIGQEKFDKYAQMYGGESAPLKKCKMLKTL